MLNESLLKQNSPSDPAVEHECLAASADSGGWDLHLLEWSDVGALACLEWEAAKVSECRSSSVWPPECERLGAIGRGRDCRTSRPTAERRTRRMTLGQAGHWGPDQGCRSGWRLQLAPSQELRSRPNADPDCQAQLARSRLCLWEPERQPRRLVYPNKAEWFWILNVQLFRRRIHLGIRLVGSSYSVMTFKVGGAFASESQRWDWASIRRNNNSIIQDKCRSLVRFLLPLQGYKRWPRLAGRFFSLSLSLSTRSSRCSHGWKIFLLFYRLCTSLVCYCCLAVAAAIWFDMKNGQNESKIADSRIWN